MKKNEEFKPVLAMYDFRGKQKFIYRTNRIKEVVGASAIIADGYMELYKIAQNKIEQNKIEQNKIAQKNSFKIDTNSFKIDTNGFEIDELGNRKILENKVFDLNEVKKNLKNEYDAVVVYEGGGNLFILYKNEDIYVEVNKKFTKWLLENTYSLKVLSVCKEVDLKADNFASDRSELYKLKNKMEFMELTLEPCNVLPITKVNKKTAQPITKIEIYDNDSEKNKKIKNKYKNKDLSYESFLKRKKYEEVITKEKAYKNEKNIENISKFLDDYVTKKGDESLLAVIFIDGNNMGNKVKAKTQGKTTYNDCVNELRTFSNQIDEIYVKKGLEDVKNKLEQLRNKEIQENPDIDQNKINYKYSYRKIVAAGDEINIICNARIAYTIAKTYLESIKEQSRKLEKSGEMGEFSSCAGIAIFHSHAPFSDAYKIAEECCESAKDISHEDKFKNECVIDFHYCQAGIDFSLEKIRKKEGAILGRPWILIGENDEMSDTIRKKYVLENYMTTEVVDNMSLEFSKVERTALKDLAIKAIQGRGIFEKEIKKIMAHSDSDVDFIAYKKGFGEESDGTKYSRDKYRSLIYDMVIMYDLWFADERQGE